MKSIGTYLMIFGAASILLYFFEMNLRLLSWIDNWGVTAGWIIRIGLIVLGLVLFIMGKRREEGN
jgi:hypothetical protein